MERRPEMNRLSSEINVTPMADIMLVLLIIFMITTPLLQTDVTVNLPKARNPLDITKGPIVLVLNREGRIFCGRTPVSEQEMMQAIQERMLNEVNKAVFLKADQALAYGKVVQVVNQCKKLGVERVGLMAEKDLND
jgi:biopolymer transport protein TolR